MHARRPRFPPPGVEAGPITFDFLAKLPRPLRVGFSQPPSKEDQMAYDDARVASADLKETHDLIASDKVEGTKVYDPSGEHIGSIERILVEKRGGKVSYAVLSFGGFLGIGTDHYP